MIDLHCWQVTTIYQVSGWGWITGALLSAGGSAELVQAKLRLIGSVFQA